MGFRELEGIHSRTDFDLKNHQKHSGKKINYYDQKSGSSFIPYVVETSLGLDRLFLAVITSALRNEKLEDGTERVVLKVPFEISPVKVAVMPLNAKDGLPEKALKIYDELKLNFKTQYDYKDSIGKRYRRQDAIGTPFCVTIDYDSLKDNSVTIRNRDSMEQERVPINILVDHINKFTSINNLLKKI
jgi:glycyl-tRNA synthetase